MAGLALAGVLALTACGGGASGTATAPAAADATTSAPAKKVPNSEEILTRMQESMRTATSLKVGLEGTLDGKAVALEVAGDRAGTNQKMTISMGDAKAEVITVDGQDYVKADKEFWVTNGIPESNADQLDGKYVSTGKRTFSNDFNIGTLLDEATSGPLSLGDKVNTKVEEDLLNGLPAYKLSQRVGNDDTTIWTETDGDYLLRKVTGSLEDGTAVEMTFDDWNEIEPFTAPQDVTRI